MNRAFDIITGLLIITAVNTACQSNVSDNDKADGFYLSENGVTILCPDAVPGDVGSVGGIEYEAVDRGLLDDMIQDGADLTAVCTSLITDMVQLFDLSSGSPGEIYDFNQDIGHWDVSNVDGMRAMFLVTTFNQDISHWDVSNVVDMSNMFFGSEFNQDISNWDVSNVRTLSGTFYNSDFTGVVEDWDVSNVINMHGTFAGTNFNGNLSKWDVSNVSRMSDMFRGARLFNQDIQAWNVSNVTSMYGMFQNTAFDQDISSWCVSNLPSEPTNFSLDAPLRDSYKPEWGTCPLN